MATISMCCATSTCRWRKGERIVICGPSGSGKSTLIRCINRLEEHQEGQIVVDGTELTSDVKNIDQVRKEVGMVFQQFNLFPHLTILENLTLAPIWVRKMPEERGRRDGHAAAQPGEDCRAGCKIPGPAFRWSAAARGHRALAVPEARIMLFDEPTSALDPEMIKEVLDTMIELARRA
jgi:general L-amino acid transport system ATP-binding protein